MRTPLLAALLLVASLAMLSPSASAQQSGSLTIYLETPPAPLTGDAPIVILGYATLTTDITGYAATNGIPVQYMVMAPEWATAVVSPASDVFQFNAPPAGMSATATRAFTITLTAGELEEDASGILRLKAVTTPPFLGMSIQGIGETLVFYEAPEKQHEENCDVLTAEQKAILLAEGAEIYNEYQASQARDEEDSEEVSVQNAGATPLSPPWIVVGAFGLVGAGVGLVLKKRLGK